MAAKLTDQHVGSDLDDFLLEEGLLEEAEAVAAKRVFAFLISEGSSKPVFLTAGANAERASSGPFIRQREPRGVNDAR